MTLQNGTLIKPIKRSNHKADVISITHEMSRLIREKSMPIYAIRIIFYLINELRNSQFQEKRAKQLKMTFDENFLSEDNTHAEFTILFKEISVNSRNNALIKKSIEYLYDFMKGWYESKNHKGEIIKSYGGFISNPNFTKKGVNFTISSFWLNKILNLDFGYNSTLYKIAFSFSSAQQVKFYLWLNLIVDFRDFKYSTINEHFEVNYSSSKDLCKEFLKPIKTFFDRTSDISFNYSYSGDVIKIVKYHTKIILLDCELRQKTKELLTANYTYSYFKRLYKIQDDKGAMLKELLKKGADTSNLIIYSYKFFIKVLRKNKQTAKDYPNEKFLISLQKCIIHCHQRTPQGKLKPNEYPKIIH